MLIEHKYLLTLYRITRQFVKKHFLRFRLQAASHLRLQRPEYYCCREYEISKNYE